MYRYVELYDFDEVFLIISKNILCLLHDIFFLLSLL